MGFRSGLQKFIAGVQDMRFDSNKGETRSHSGFSNPFGELFNLNAFNTNVTAFNGSRLTTVYNCLNVLSQDISALDFNVFKEIAPGNNEKQPRNDTIQRLISTQPNKWMNATQFWQYMLFWSYTRF